MKNALRFCFVCMATVLIAGLLDVNRAHAGLTGYTVSGGFAVNESGGPFDAGTIFETTDSTTVPGTLTEVPVYAYATFSDNTLTQVLNSSFATFPFTGAIYEADPSAPAFTSVTIESNTLAGFTAADVSFNDHEVALNFSGLSVIGAVVLDFTTASSVPEPSSIILLCLGALGLRAMEVRRRIRKRATADEGGRSVN